MDAKDKWNNTLFTGDNLEILKTLPSESVDLIYIDPPFFSNRNYEVIWGDAGEVRSFKDRWSGGMEHYIGWLKERVEEMYRVLKPTGSFYLHCDWHADAYIRVGILDKVFGMNGFVDEICWKRHSSLQKGSQFAGRSFGSIVDRIFLYTKTKKYFINTTREIKKTEIEEKFPLIDENGRRYYDDSAHLWCSPRMGARPNLCYEWMGFKNPYPSGWRLSKEKLQEEYEKGNIVIKKNGKLQRRKYIEEYKGIPVGNLWDDIYTLDNKESIGYPTQKPEALLERIIKASSNEGDVVLDAFCGGGTTIAVADKLNRKWVGIDQSVQAIKVTEARLYNQRGLFQAPFSVKLHKYDYDILRYQDAFEFESWIIEQFGGEPNVKQRGDMGIDGKKNGVPIQVKRSDNIGRDVVDRFPTAMERFYGGSTNLEKRKHDKEVDGYIIAFSFGKGAVEEVARVKNDKGLIIQLVKVEDIIPIATKPKLAMHFEDLGLDDKNRRKIKFSASVEEKNNIELYQWDFNYKEENGFKAEIMIDKEGQQTYEFSPGEYYIACKAIDMEGLESIEILKLKINGIVKRI